MDDSVLVRFAKLCCQNGVGNLTRIWAFLDLTASRRKIVTRHWLSLERPEPRKTLYFLPAVEVKGTFAIGGAGGAAVEV